MKDIAIVIPTIRPELMTTFNAAWKELFARHDVEYIIVADGDNPEVIHNGKTYSKDAIDSLHLVQNRYTGVVNLGYAFVAENFPNVEYIMTFHDDETPIGDPIQDHIDALNMKVPISWLSSTIINRPTDYMRGFPYNVREEAPVVFSHGVWRGVPDYDAPTQLLADKNYQPEFYKGPVPKGILFPLCGMNLAFRRCALPLVYFAPVAEYEGSQRFDDIWGGIELKKELDSLDWAMVTGYSICQHNRASNVFENLKKESVGIQKNEGYWKGELDDWYVDFKSKREKWKQWIHSKRESL